MFNYTEDTKNNYSKIQQIVKVEQKYRIAVVMACIERNQNRGDNWDTKEVFFFFFSKNKYSYKPHLKVIVASGKIFYKFFCRKL